MSTSIMLHIPTYIREILGISQGVMCKQDNYWRAKFSKKTCIEIKSLKNSLTLLVEGVFSGMVLPFECYFVVESPSSSFDQCLVRLHSPLQLKTPHYFILKPYTNNLLTKLIMYQFASHTNTFFASNTHGEL